MIATQRQPVGGDAVTLARNGEGVIEARCVCAKKLYEEDNDGRAVIVQGSGGRRRRMIVEHRGGTVIECPRCQRAHRV